jgi:BirA family transcriptional regulator, biotin operon repressor / biotin---[acetyl-CoA-carboxylase] ligase
MNLLKEEILSRLRSYPGEYVSGAGLSESLGLTRAAVWKQVQALRQEGYTISAAPRKGYRLEREPERLDQKTLAGRRILYYPAVESTNTTARTLAEEGAAGGSVVIAEEQLKGRGRRGRQWFSPPGKGLWFSIILRPDCIPPAAAAPVTLVAAAALGRCLRSETGLHVTLKWPNDLLLDGKKIGGILTELKGEAERVEYLIIGAGLNVNQGQSDFPPELRETAGSLALAAGRTFDRTALFLPLISALQEACTIFFEEGFSRFHGWWIELNDTLGKEVAVTWPGGTIRGRALKLDASGALLLRDEKGEEHRISYGEIV